MITTIFVIGAGYVGLSNAVLLAQPKLANQVTLVDIDAKKLPNYNSRSRRLTMR